MISDKSFVSLLVLFWLFEYMNCAQRKNFWGDFLRFFWIGGHTVTFWLVMMVIQAACMSDGDGCQILTEWWMVIISGPPPLATYESYSNRFYWKILSIYFLLLNATFMGYYTDIRKVLKRYWQAAELIFVRHVLY